MREEKYDFPPYNEARKCGTLDTGRRKKIFKHLNCYITSLFCPAKWKCRMYKNYHYVALVRTFWALSLLSKNAILAIISGNINWIWIPTQIFTYTAYTINPTILHYLREHTPQIRYLPSDVNISVILKDFREKYPDIKLFYELYRQ